MSLAKMRSECDLIPQTRHYDIKMSKRTRKSFNQWAVNNVQKDAEGKEEAAKTIKKGDEEQDDDHKSLKDLIEARNSLGKHFTQDEKQLQVVVKQHEERLDGLKLGKMARFLTRIINIKKKKSVLRLKL